MMFSNLIAKEAVKSAAKQATVHAVVKTAMTEETKKTVKTAVVSAAAGAVVAGVTTGLIVHHVDAKNSGSDSDITTTANDDKIADKLADAIIAEAEKGDGKKLSDPEKAVTKSLVTPFLKSLSNASGKDMQSILDAFNASHNEAQQPAVASAPAPAPQPTPAAQTMTATAPTVAPQSAAPGVVTYNQGPATFVQPAPNFVGEPNPVFQVLRSTQQ